MSKFIQTLDEDGDRVIINVEAITNLLVIDSTLQIFLKGNRVVKLCGENADIIWKLFSEQSLHLYQQLQEDKK